jgi:hypothetical protein
MVFILHQYDAVTKTANIKVYEGPFKDESFRFVPTAWKVFER